MSMKKQISFVIVFILITIFCFNYKKIVIKTTNNEYLFSNGSYITEDEYINLGIERAYVIGNYLFDISNNFNPSLKDLLIASSYVDIDNVKVYELKISTNIYGDIVKEYRELLDNVLLDSFPNITIKYVYDSVDSFNDINPSLNLEYGIADSLQLSEADFKALNIVRAYLIGDYLFDLDNGYNPSLNDLLIAATTSYTNDLKVYELKISENINGDIVEEYSELLSDKTLTRFPTINCKYVYDKNIKENTPKKTLKFKDTLEFVDFSKNYAVDGIIVNEARSKNNLDLEYEYFKSDDCSGEKLSKIYDIGVYSVLAKSTTTENIIGTSKCVKLSVNYGDLTSNSYYIDPENFISSEKYLNVFKTDALIETSGDNSYWANEIEYNSEINKGKSRFTIKVDKGFVQDVKTNYDITIDYYDKGDGIVLMQSSSTNNNVINYSAYGFGGYVEETWWNWDSRLFYIKNLSFGLTDTGQWKQYTFNVTDEFFEKDIDNYVHFYFGKPSDNNENDYIKIKKITITKRSFYIESANENDKKVVGNIYTDDEFGMGFSIKNILKSNKKIDLSYEIYDINSNKVYEKDLGLIDINSNATKKYYISEFNDLNIYGVFDLKIKVLYDDVTEFETIKFSRIKSDLTNKNNDFLALNINFGFNGWATNKHLSESLNLSKKLGINNLRYGINNPFIYSDIEYNGYTNILGRYESIYDYILIDNNQNVLPVIWNIKSNIELDDNGKLTSDCFETLKNEVIEYYLKLATKYGDYFTYYEILNEWNNGSPMKAVTASQYAEIVVEVSKALKSVDSDAKIVAIASSDDIWCSSNYCSYYSPT